MDGSSERDTIGSTPITDTNKWYHVVAVYDGTKPIINERVSLYIDGIAETTAISYSAGTPAYLPAATVQLGIGSAATIAGGVTNVAYSFNGLIDEPRIYGRALSADEVFTLY